MSIRVQCSCGEPLRAPETRAGKSIRCPECDRRVDVPFPDDEEQIETAARAPRRKKNTRRTGTGSGSRVLVYCLLAVVLLRVIGGGSVGVYFLVRKSTSGSSANDLKAAQSFAVHEKYLPDDCASFESSRVSKIWSVPLYKEVGGSAGQQEATKLGVSTNDIERLTHASYSVDESVTIVSLTQNVDAPALARNGEWTEVNAGNYTMYRGKPYHNMVQDVNGKTVKDEWVSNAWAVPESNVYLEGRTELVEAILKRDAKPRLMERMRKGMELADFASCKVGVDGRNVLPPPGSSAIVEDETVVAQYQEVNIDADVTQSLFYVCKDTASAEVKKKKIEEEERDWAKKRGPAPYRSDTFALSGTKVSHTMKLTGSGIKQQIKNAPPPRPGVVFIPIMLPL